MNLHAIVRGAISSVNPDIPVQVQISTGYTTTSAGKRVPSYAAPVTMTAQVQALTSTDLRKLDGLNIQGSMRTMYLSGSLNGVSRLNQKGGDLITLPDGTVNLTTMVLEQWPDWVKVACTQQVNAV
jgi:hypothetical protein